MRDPCRGCGSWAISARSMSLPGLLLWWFGRFRVSGLGPDPARFWIRRAFPATMVLVMISMMAGASRGLVPHSTFRIRDVGSVGFARARWYW